MTQPSLKPEIGAVWLDPPRSKIASMPAAFTYTDADLRIFPDEAICLAEMAAVL